jgi:hypothetical protein
MILGRPFPELLQECPVAFPDQVRREGPVRRADMTALVARARPES